MLTYQSTRENNFSLTVMSSISPYEGRFTRKEVKFWNLFLFMSLTITNLPEALAQDRWVAKRPGRGLLNCPRCVRDEKPSASPADEVASFLSPQHSLPTSYTVHNLFLKAEFNVCRRQIFHSLRLFHRPQSYFIRPAAVFHCGCAAAHPPDFGLEKSPSQKRWFIVKK